MSRPALTLLLLSLLTFLLGAAAARSQASSDPYDIIDAAQNAAQKGDLGRAISLFEQALSPPLVKKLPREHVAQVAFNLGFTFQQAGRFDKALPAFDQAIRLKPDFEQALVKAAFSAKMVGNPGLAAGYLHKAVAASGGRNPETLSYLGDTLNNLKRFNESEAVYKRAIAAVRGQASKAALAKDAKLRGLLGQLHHSLADTMINSKKYLQAQAEYRQAQGYRPEDPAVMAGLLFCKLELADWAGVEELQGKLLSAAGKAVVERGEPSPVSPYQSLFLDMPGGLRKAISASWSSRHEQEAKDGWMRELEKGQQQQEQVGEGNRRQLTSTADAEAPATAGAAFSSSPPLLRLGYLSRRFEHYPGLHLMQGLFSRHSTSKNRHWHSAGAEMREDGGEDGSASSLQLSSDSGSSSSSSSRVSVHCFAHGPDDGKEERKQLQRECSSFQDISAVNASTGHAAIRATGTHVLLDYDGMHDFNSLNLLAGRPAPVQASFLGFAATTGVPRKGGVAGKGGKESAASFLPSFMQYFIADPLTAPAEAAEQMFTESLVYLPGAYQPQNPDQKLSGQRPVITSCLAGSGSAGVRGVALEGVSEAREEEAAEGQQLTLEALQQQLRAEEKLVFSLRSDSAAALFPSSGSSGSVEAEERDILPVEDTEDCRAAIRTVSPSVSEEQLEAACPAVLEDEDDEQALQQLFDGYLSKKQRQQPVQNAKAPEEAHSPSRRGSDAVPGSASSCSCVSPLVLACFNRWSKIDSPMFQSWLQILQQQPAAVLWLYGGGSQPYTWQEHGQQELLVQQKRSASATAAASSSSSSSSNSSVPPHVLNLWQEAAAHGVAPWRIVFAAKAPRARHLYRHYAADAMLDTSVYGAHTTTADGLFTGLPLITAPGSSFASRVGSALLAAAGVEPAADIGTAGGGLKQYITAAAQLLQRPAVVRELRALLHGQVMDTIAENQQMDASATLAAGNGSNSSAAVAATTATALQEGLGPASKREAGSPSASEGKRTLVYDSLRFAASLEGFGRAAWELQALQKAPVVLLEEKGEKEEKEEKEEEEGAAEGERRLSDLQEQQQQREWRGFSQRPFHLSIGPAPW